MKRWSQPSETWNIANKQKMVSAKRLNGPRTLSSERLSYLVVSNSELQASPGADQNADFMICATHFLGDGMALHQFANDFFTLLGSALDQVGLASVLAAEWLARCATESVRMLR
jgi:hypothetical protein